MAKIAVFGAGMVARPLVTYLLDQPGYTVMVGSRTVSKAEKMIAGRKNGVAKALTAEDVAGIEREVRDADVVVSLLPYTHHVMVANFCLKHKKHLVTTSYVSDAMRELDSKAKGAGIALLNECGLDPGIDHMSAMRIIHDVEKRGGKVLSFRSTTGALPAHENCNNPFGYKFSWAPRGVLLASRNPAMWLQDGKEISIPGEELFENYTIQDVPGAGSFENYPNRNSVQYKEIYGLKDAKTVYRGTFRMTGWCETMREIAALGWLSEEQPKGFAGKTYGDLTRHLVGAEGKKDLAEAAASKLKLKPYSAVIKRLEWLGLFGGEPLPADKNNPLDYLNVLTLKKLDMKPGDKDMIVMHHELMADFGKGKRESITSTLVDYGQPDGDTSVARTVALPAAIAVRMLVDGKIKSRGVLVPVTPEIYDPILDELEEIGIKFVERKQPA